MPLKGMGRTWQSVFEKFVYLAVEICHQETLPSATPSFPVGKKLCETEKHQKCLAPKCLGGAGRF